MSFSQSSVLALLLGAVMGCGATAPSMDGGVISFQSNPDAGMVDDAGTPDSGTSGDAGTTADAGRAIDAGSGTAVVNGMELGQSLHAASALATLGPGQNASVLISSTPNICYEYHDAEIVPGAQYLQIQVSQVDFNYSGTYDVQIADLIDYNTSCVMTEDLQPTMGSLTIASADLTEGGSVSGSFDLAFGAGELTGTFSAPYCPIDFTQQIQCH